MSWKVRRSATKCLSAIITTRPERLSEIYAKVNKSFKQEQKDRQQKLIICSIGGTSAHCQIQREGGECEVRYFHHFRRCPQTDQHLD